MLERDFARKHDWPIPQLHHRGGDTLLGALIHQQGCAVARFNKDVWINADEAGRPSKARRRGMDAAPLWRRWRRAVSDDLSHQDFVIQVTPANEAAR